MTLQEIQELIITILAPIGGVSGVIAIIAAVAKVIAASKNSKALAKQAESFAQLKTDIIAELETKLNCTLDVDISAKLNGLLENLETKYLDNVRGINTKLEAMRKLNIEMTRIMSTTRKITEEQRAGVLALIDECSTLITAPETELKPTLRLELPSKVTEDSPDKAEAAKQERKHRVIV